MKYAFLCLLLVSTTALGQDKKPRQITPKRSISTDVNGWGKIKWGMSVAQARTLYSSEAHEPQASVKESTKYVDRFVIPNLKLGDVSIQASVRTLPGSDRIAEVELSMPADNFREPASTRIAAHEDILNGLTQKYGKPSRHEQKDSDSLTDITDVWLFPSTTITLQYIEMKIGFGLLDVQYTAVDKKLKDVL